MRPAARKRYHRVVGRGLETRVDQLKLRMRLLTMTCLALALVAVSAAPALADQLSEKQAEADRIERQIEALNNKAEVATERFDAARSNYNELSEQVRASNAKLKKLKKRQKVLQSHLDTRANEMYRSGPLGFVSVLLSVDDFEELDSTVRVLTSMNAQDAATVSELKQTRAEEAQTNAKLSSDQAEADKQQKSMAANEKSVKSELASRQGVLDGVNGEVRSILAQRKAAEEAAAAARARAAREALAKQTASSTPKKTSSDSGSSGSSGGGDAPSSSKGAEAVRYAMTRIGKPYRYGASGPNAFDCSGLTMWSYGKAGVSLPHSSGAQYSEGPHISKSNLEPGDLVFFGRPIHHVGMYVGGGNFIEAPYTGLSVRVVSLGRRSDYVGACRPK
jgi:peptidoglycan DL-endopeptidase CwlO